MSSQAKQIGKSNRVMQSFGDNLLQWAISIIIIVFCLTIILPFVNIFSLPLQPQ